MSSPRRRLSALFALLVPFFAPAAESLSHAPGPFTPSWESLSRYEIPAWFADAKFGIWAHWRPQGAPERGDWYARRMYLPPGDPLGYRVPEYHREHYGHPSEFGFKEIIRDWKAERFDPAALLARYKAAGARYFVAMANHHDNFALWDSRHQPWNSVRLGPKRDLVGEWAEATRAAGLRFGVSVHAARAWSWYEPAQGADAAGPRAGVPFDGKLRAADGAGKWWDGLDPQDLYAQNHAVGEKPTWAYARRFYGRTIDLIDHARPDLVYFDDPVLPLRYVSSEIGLSIAAHHYNTNLARNGGRNEAVMNTKKLAPEHMRALVDDIERGVADGIRALPWQTDTCIGDWHYSRERYERKCYRGAGVIIPMLADIVSKNGNLLLSVPLRADGTLDDQEERILAEIGDWLGAYGEAIYGTRPWEIYGEGPSTRRKREPGKFGGLKDAPEEPLTAEDIRFTRRADGGAIYAIVLAQPDEPSLRIAALGEGAGIIASVELLGGGPEPTWRQTAAGLEVAFSGPPPLRGPGGLALRVTGERLRPAASSFAP